MFTTFLDEWLEDKDTHVKQYFTEFKMRSASTPQALETEIARLNMQMGVILTHGVEFQYLWSIRDWFKEALVRWYALEVE